MWGINVNRYRFGVGGPLRYSRRKKELGGEGKRVRGRLFKAKNQTTGGVCP